MFRNLINFYFSPSRMLKTVPQVGELPPTREIAGRAMNIIWPAVLESVLIGLVGMIDTMMVSTLGTAAISAVGLTMQPKYIALCAFFAVNVAVSALVARRKGEGDRHSANRIMQLGIFLTIILTALISIVMVSFASPIIEFCGSQADTHNDAVIYMSIIVGGQIFNTLSMVINAAQRGAGNTRIAMRTNVASNLVNIVFNYLLIGGNFGFPALGVAGAAIATVIGTVVALLMSVRSIMAPDGFLSTALLSKFHFNRQELSSIANMSSGAFVEQVCLRVGFLIFSLIVARLGTRDFAVHNICMNVLNFTFFFGDGLSTAAVTLVGQSLGAKRPDMARIYTGLCQRIGFLISIVLSIALLLGAKQIVGLFSRDASIIADGSHILYLLTYIVLLQIAMVIYCGCLRSAGDVRFVALIGLVSVSILRPLLGWALCWGLGWGLYGAWIGLACEQTSRFVMSYLRFRTGKWTRIQL